MPVALAGNAAPRAMSVPLANSTVIGDGGVLYTVQDSLSHETLPRSGLLEPANGADASALRAPAPLIGALAVTRCTLLARFLLSDSSLSLSPRTRKWASQFQNTIKIAPANPETKQQQPWSRSEVQLRQAFQIPL